MNNLCGAMIFQGLSDCRKLLQNIVGIIISIKDQAGYTLAELETITKTKGYMSTENGIVSIYLPLNEYDETTEAVKFETGANGIRMKTEDGMPQATAYIMASVADYVTLFGLDYSECDVELITKDGYRIMTPLANTERQGFRGIVNIQKGMPKIKDGLKMYPIYLTYTDLQQWEKMEAIPMQFTTTDIQGCVPVGLTIQATGPMVAGAQPLKCTKRSSATGKAGLTDIVVIDSSGLTTPACAITDSGGGAYSLACTKATSTPLAAGDWVDIQAFIVATTTVTYASNIIRLYGTT